MGTVATDNPVQQVQQMQRVQHPAAQIPDKHCLSAAARVATTGRFWPYARGILRIPRYSSPKTLAKTKTWPQLDRYDYGHEHHWVRASQHSRPRSSLPNRGPSRRRMRPHLHRTRQRNHHGTHEMGRVQPQPGTRRHARRRAHRSPRTIPRRPRRYARQPPCARHPVPQPRRKNRHLNRLGTHVLPTRRRVRGIRTNPHQRTHTRRPRRGPQGRPADRPAAGTHRRAKG